MMGKRRGASKGKKRQQERKRGRRVLVAIATKQPVFLREADPASPPQCFSCGHLFDLTNPSDPVVINFGEYLACSCGELSAPARFGIEVMKEGCPK